MLPLGLFVLFAAVGFMDDGNGRGSDTEDENLGGDAQDEDGDGGTPDTGDDGSDDAGDDAGDGDTTDTAGGLETNDDALSALDVTLETDPATGAITVTAPEDAAGSLVVMGNNTFEELSPSCCSGQETYSTSILWVPEGVDVDEVFDAFDFNAFYADAPGDTDPTIEDIFGEAGITELATLDQGIYQYIDASQGGGVAEDISVLDTRTVLPDIESNLDIAYYQLDVQAQILDSGDADILDFDFGVGFNPFTDGLTEDELVAAFDAAVDVDAEDGDVVDGTEFGMFIQSAPGDPTALTIFGGEGEDQITAGLNDTVITNDDAETDTIQVGEPLSFGEVYDEVPILEAGQEDIIEVDGEGNFVIRFEQDVGNGVTDVYYHILTADTAPVDPSETLSGGLSLSLGAFYAQAGWQLIAVGGLGSLVEQGGTVMDTTLLPPSFEGIDQGLFSVTLGQDGLVTADTQLTSGWPPLA